MIKAIFFDLTGTLQNFNWDKQWKLLVPILNKTLKRKISTDKVKQAYQQVYESYRIGKIKNDYDFFDLMLRQLGLNATKKQIQKLAKQHLEIRKQFTWLPDKYEETLNELHKEFKLAIVSSCVRTWAEYDYKNIFKSSLKKHFDLVCTSQETGYLKESGKLFEIAIKRLKLNKKEIVFVGDSYEGDVLTSKRHGLKSILLSNKKSGKEYIKIKKFKDLLKIKEKIKRL